MKYPLALLFSAAAMFSCAQSASAVTTTFSNDVFTFHQTYSVAPNFHFGNPDWLPYVENMRASAATGFATSAGDSSLPSYFEVASQNIPLSGAVVTDATGPGLTSATGARLFNSWRGQADPGTVFGPAFADQFGNHVFSPYVIVAKDNIPFTLTSIVRNSYTTSNGPDPLNTFTYTDFTNTRVGITDFGIDNVLGGGDDTYINDGSPIADTPILAFIATGSAIAFQMSQQFDGSPWPIELADADIFETYSQQWPGGFTWDNRADYTINYMAGPDSESITLTGQTVVVPEPTFLAPLALGALLFLSRLRRRR